MRCEATRAIHKNGIMFVKIQCALDLLNQQKSGLIKVRSFTSIVHEIVGRRVATALL